MKTIKKIILAFALLLTAASFAQPPDPDGFANPKIDKFWIAIDPGHQLNSLSGGYSLPNPLEDLIWRPYVQPPIPPETEPTFWYNIFFYNDPIDLSRMKKIRMGFYVQPFIPGLPTELFYVVNWSTPESPPGGPYPLPGMENMIRRSPINGPFIVPTDPPQFPPSLNQWFELYFEIPDYNPEWVSVDIYGSNIIIREQPWPPPETSPLFSWWLQNPTAPGSGIIVHECLPKADLEFGDAPEEDLAYLNPNIMGHFPTCTQVGPPNSFISHGCPSWLFFGGYVDCELDGNAGWCPTFGPNQYNSDECGTIPYSFPTNPDPNIGIVDEGLFKPVPNTLGTLQPSFYGYFVCGAGNRQPLGKACETAVWGQDIDIWLNGNNPQLAGTGFFNLLVDWNQDGDWLDVVKCDQTPVPEHVIVNFPINLVGPGFGYIGPISQYPNVPIPNFQIGPKGGYVWARFTLTEIPVQAPWDGTGQFNDGETEDYLLYIEPKGTVIPVSNWALFVGIGLIMMLTLLIWWRKR
jgi:hypothetical protein